MGDRVKNPTEVQIQYISRDTILKSFNSALPLEKKLHFPREGIWSVLHTNSAVVGYI